MVCHEVFALISDNEVKNVIVGDFYNCNEIARIEYGEDAVAVEVTQYPVQSGDSYENGNFYRIVDGKKVSIDPVPTDSQKLDMLMSDNAELSKYVELIATELLNTTGGM